MKSLQSLKEEVSIPSLGGMSQEEGRRTTVSQSYFHSANPDLDLTGKLYKREVGGKPYSVLVDNKMAAKASSGDQNIGQLPTQHTAPQQHQQYFREGGAMLEAEKQGSQAGNNGTSDDTEDDDEEEEGEDEECDEEAFKREQIIVEVNLNNQTLHVSKGDKTGTTPDTVFSKIWNIKMNSKNSADLCSCLIFGERDKLMSILVKGGWNEKQNNECDWN